MKIVTITGSDGKMANAIQDATIEANKYMVRFSSQQVMSATAQSFIDRSEQQQKGSHIGPGQICFHIITIVHE